MPLWNPSTRLPPNYIEGFELNNVGFTSDTTLRPGRTRSDDNSFDIVLSSSVTIDAESNGANALDTGTIAAGFYAAWAIADSSGVNPTAGLLSLSRTSPTMPSGYTKKRRVGWRCINKFLCVVGASGSGTLGVSCLGNTRDYIYDPYHSAPTIRVLSGGSSTTYVDISLSAFAPPPASAGISKVRLLSVLSATDDGDAAYFSSTGNATGDAFYRHVAGDSAAGTASSSMQFEMPVDVNNNIYYKVVPASGGAVSVSLYVLGFTDQV